MDEFILYKTPRPMPIDEICFLNYGEYKQIDRIYKLNKELKDMGILIEKGYELKLPLMRVDESESKNNHVVEMVELWD